MALDPEQREKVEDVIMDLHYTSSKYVESGKDVHKKMLAVNISEALEILNLVKNDITDDEKVLDYKIHLLIPFQIYELLSIREEQNCD